MKVEKCNIACVCISYTGLKVDAMKERKVFTLCADLKSIISGSKIDKMNSQQPHLKN